MVLERGQYKGPVGRSNHTGPRYRTEAFVLLLLFLVKEQCLSFSLKGSAIAENNPSKNSVFQTAEKPPFWR